MSKEIEFKIPMTREEAEKVINIIFQKYLYQLKIKTDRYWNSIDDSSAKVRHQIVRLRSTNIVSDKMIEYFSKDNDCDVKNWFFYPTDKMFDKDEVEKWEDPKSETKLYLTYKHRDVTEKGESNSEHEEELTRNQYKTLIKCFDALGYRYFQKIKRCMTFKLIGKEACGEITIDFDNVHDMYYFEIEYVINDEPVLKDGPVLTEEGAIKELEDIAKEFGLDPSKKDNRLWKDIIFEHENSKKLEA